MADHEAAYREFESQWQRAIEQQAAPQMIEAEDSDTGNQPIILNQQQTLHLVEIESFSTENQLTTLLEQLAGLADRLNSSDIIDSHQHEQMQAAIGNLREVIEAIDPAILSEALQSQS